MAKNGDADFFIWRCNGSTSHVHIRTCMYNLLNWQLGPKSPKASPKLRYNAVTTALDNIQKPHIL